MTQTVGTPENLNSANVIRPMMQPATSWGESNLGRKSLEVEIRTFSDGSFTVGEPEEKVETLRNQAMSIGRFGTLRAMENA